MSRATERIPVYEPLVGQREAQLASEAVLAGDVSGSGGAFIEQFEREFARWVGAEHAVAVSSGTAALHIAAVLAGVRPGDEVLVSAATNIATAIGIVQQGGVVVPVDSDPETWCMDTSLLPELVTDRTRAVFPVHLFGHPVDMSTVSTVAIACGLFVAEDAAEAHGAEWCGYKAGAIGNVGCFSFYANKVITTGEGGALVTGSPQLAERARSLRNLCFGRPRFVHQDVGWNYRMTNVQAAIGCAQMERIDEIVAAKRDLARRYTERLSGIPGLRLPVERAGARSVYWMYGVVVEEEFGLTRDQLAESLRASDVETRTMFCPMNLQPALLERHAVLPVPCPVAEDLWARGLYLPSTPTLTDAQLDRICEAVAGVRVQTC